MLAGACAAIGLYAAMKIVHVFGLDIAPWSKWLLSVTLFAAGGFAGGRLVSRDGAMLRSAVITYAALLLGVALGVVFWNGLEDFVFSRLSAALYEERKLFPVDVILLWMLGWIPMLAGLVAGVLVPRGLGRPQK